VLQTSGSDSSHRNLYGMYRDDSRIHITCMLNSLRSILRKAKPFRRVLHSCRLGLIITTGLQGRSSLPNPESTAGVELFIHSELLDPLLS